MNLALILLLAYSVGLIAVGLWIGRLVTTTGDFFVAGRHLGAGLLFSTVLAANIGAGSTVGAAGLGYRDGLGAWWWNGSAGIGSLILAFWIGPKIWRIASRHQLLTVGDFLEHRYNRTVRAIIAVLIWASTLFILAGQLVAGAAVLNVVAGVPKTTGCLLAGAVMTSYFVAGGLLSSAWVNLIQLVVLLLGFVVAVPVVLHSVGGWAGLASSTHAPAGFLDFWHSSGPGSGWMFLGLLVPAFVVSPGLIQKVYGGANERAVRVGIAANGLVLMAFAFIPALLGMAARVHYPDLANETLALPTVLLTELPVGLGSLALAAVFSAEVSSADAILFMLATSLSQDLYRRFLNPRASDKEVLRVARWAAAAGGVLGVGLSVVFPTVIAPLSIFYAILGVCLFVPMVAGLYLRRAGAPEAMASIGLGALGLLVAQFATGGRGIGMFTPNVIGLMAATAGLLAVGAQRAMTNGT